MGAVGPLLENFNTFFVYAVNKGYPILTRKTFKSKPGRRARPARRSWAVKRSGFRYPGGFGFISSKAYYSVEAGRPDIGPAGTSSK